MIVKAEQRFLMQAESLKQKKPTCKFHKLWNWGEKLHV